MTSINLTRTEAQQRSSMLADISYDVALDLRGEETFSSVTTVRFRCTQAGSTFIDLRADELTSVRLNGVPLPLTSYTPEHGISLSGLQVADYELQVVATIAYSRTGEGLHRFVDPADGKAYLYTQFETADAKRVFACFDQPDLKATYRLAFTTPNEWTVITNGPVVRTAGRAAGNTAGSATGSATGQAAADEEGTTWVTDISYPLSTYLVALCAGPYHEVRDTWRGEVTAYGETGTSESAKSTAPALTTSGAVEVPLGLYCRDSVAQHLDAERLFTETKQGFDFYHRNFGVAYPFDKYDQVFVPEFNAGAMENAGCVTIRDEYVFSSQATHWLYERRADTILHELAHMWFGDLVTMAWWDDLWLNESFATWAAAISQAEETRYDTAWVTFANVEKSWAYQQDQLPTTHPISTDASDIETVEQNFDGITYAKGASVLKQLQAYVGRDNFFAGVRRHFAAHAWSNATFADLLGHLEDSSGRDLSFWASQWLKTTGVNSLAADFTVEDGKYSSFAITQTGDTLRTHRIAVGLYRLDGSQVTRFKRVEIDIDGARTEVGQLLGADAADLVLVNDDDLTYCLQDLDKASLEFVVANIDKVAEPMARTLCWSATWEMTRAGTMRARDFAALVARGAAMETELAVLERILGQAIVAVSTYADPAWAKEEGWDLLAETCLAGATSADSERALIFTQALAKLKLNDSARDFLENLLSTSNDNDVRWRALAALAADGALGDDKAAGEHIAAELERDNTSTGYQWSVQARAAINSASNKRTVWEEIIGGQLTNLELRHKLAGLNYPGADEYLRDMTAQYFDVAEKVWQSQSSEIALTTVTGAYPTWEVSKEGLSLADAFLARNLPAGLRRAVTEQRDRVARALRNRAFDAAK